MSYKDISILFGFYVSLVTVCWRGSELILWSLLQLIKSAMYWKNPSVLQVLLCVPPGKRTSCFCSDALASKSWLIMFGGTNSSSSPDRKRRGSLMPPTRLRESHLFLESNRRGSCWKEDMKRNSCSKKHEPRRQSLCWMLIRNTVLKLKRRSKQARRH